MASRVGVVAGQRRDELVIAARSPRTSRKIRGVAAAPSAVAERLVLVEPGSGGSCRRRRGAPVRGGLLVAARRTAIAARARQAASAFSAPIRAASASSPSRSSVAPIAAAASVLAGGVGWASRASVLIRLISFSQSRAAASSSSVVAAAATRGAEPRLGRVLRCVDGPRVGGQAAVTAAAPRARRRSVGATRSAPRPPPHRARARVASSQRSSAIGARGSAHRARSRRRVGRGTGPCGRAHRPRSTSQVRRRRGAAAGGRRSRLGSGSVP